MRRCAGATISLSVVAAAAVAQVGVAGTSGGGSGAFAPKERVISRSSFLGITPRSSYAQVRGLWGRSPLEAPRTGVAGVGRSQARWGNYFAYGSTVAVAYYADRRVGARPFRYSVDLQYARRTGVELRTVRGDRAGTSTKTFRRHWPRARRHLSEPGYVWYVAPSAHAGWRLAFLLVNGQLRYAELASSSYVERCVVRRCSTYPGS